MAEEPQEPTGGGAEPVSQEPAVKPEFLPDQFWADDQADYGAFRSEFETLSQFKSEAEAAQASLPQSADDYAVALREGFEVPEGVEYQLNPDDPRVPALREFAHKHGLSQDAMHDLLEMHAGGEIEAIKTQQSHSIEEMKKLGSDASGRVERIKNSLISQLPKSQGEALADALTTADAVIAVDALLGRMTGKPAAPAEPATPADPRNGMTGMEALSHLRR